MADSQSSSDWEEQPSDDSSRDIWKESESLSESESESESGSESESEVETDNQQDEFDPETLNNTYCWLFTFNRDDESLSNFMGRRFPTFADRLKALGDALSLVHRFIALPDETREGIDDSRIKRCTRLTRMWNTYVCYTRALVKVFDNATCVYFQVQVQGENITWSVPHPRSIDLPNFQDFPMEYSLMQMFFDFYEYFLGSVVSDLYEKLELKYETLCMLGLEVNPLEYDAQEKVTNSRTTDQELFKNMKFFLNYKMERLEIPFEVLNVMIYAFGGVSLWKDESDQEITHEIVDYGPYNEVFPSRKYIYAQWILDSINSGKIRPTEEYLPGRFPPPYVDTFGISEENHIPEYVRVFERVIASFNTPGKNTPFYIQHTDYVEKAMEEEIDRQEEQHLSEYRELLAGGFPYDTIAEKDAEGKQTVRLVKKAKVNDDEARKRRKFD